MTTNRTVNLLRVLFVCFALFVGMQVGEVLCESQRQGALWGLTAGLAIVLADRLLLGFSLRLFSAATCGLLLGLVASRFLLASGILGYASKQTCWVVSLCTYSFFGYIGMMLAIRSTRDEFALIVPYIRFRETAIHDPSIVVDTSVLIDGRIQEICRAGFVSTSLVAPRFVLEELQRLADSSDPLKRSRGRRGLDLLQEMQRNQGMAVTIHESGLDPNVPVDSRLIQIAQILSARIITTDSNLARIARLQGVSVLNINELNRATAPVVAAGEELELTLTKPGRDAHQAVGFLPDGSMIVVNHSRSRIGETVPIVIGGALQTNSGRMYFAELKPVPVRKGVAEGS